MHIGGTRDSLGSALTNLPNPQKSPSSTQQPYFQVPNNFPDVNKKGTRSRPYRRGQGPASLRGHLSAGTEAAEHAAQRPCPGQPCPTAPFWLRVRGGGAAPQPLPPLPHTSLRRSPRLPLGLPDPSRRPGRMRVRRPTSGPSSAASAGSAPPAGGAEGGGAGPSLAKWRRLPSAPLGWLPWDL